MNRFSNPLFESVPRRCHSLLRKACGSWILGVFSYVFLLNVAQAQEIIEAAGAQKIHSTIYVCEQGSVIMLRNTQPLADERACMVKTVTTRVVAADVAATQVQTSVQPTIAAGVPVYPRAWNDPQPTEQTLIVGAQIPANVQWQRDLGRQRILQAELIGAEQRLTALQAEYRNGEPERLGSEKNYQKYLDRVADLKQNIRLTEANIAALRRELNTVGIQP